MSEIMYLEFVTKGYKACSFKGKLKHYSSKDLHRHSYHEILLIKNGVSVLLDEYTRQPLFGSNLAWIPSDTPHRSLVIGKYLEYMVLFVDKNAIKANNREIKIFNVSELGLALFHKLCSINNVEIAEGFLGECFDLFLSVIKKDIKNLSQIVRLPESKNSNNLRITEFIHNNYNKKLNISDFKTVLPYTGRHISRIFSEELKISIFEYLRLYRVLMTSIFISSENKKITDIAFECGYESLSSFYKDFKYYFGISPREFRKIQANPKKIFK